jgi:hypothetical protein
LTIHRDLFRLCSGLAVLRRLGGRGFSGDVVIPDGNNWRRMHWMIGKLRSVRRFYRVQRGYWSVALLAVAVTGCASMGGLTKDSSAEAKQALVSERINARWQALIKGDVDTAYTYMSAASQEAMPLKVYKVKHKPGMWRSVRIESLQCEAEICKAKMILTYDHERMKGIQTPFEESWIIEKGTAWYVNRERD